MSEIFISYASADRERARWLARRLEQQGWTVWWDRTIPPGRTFDEVIEEAIDSAQCMVVLWSNGSVASQWVKTEAAEGARRRVLVPALIDDVKIPLEFRRIQAANLIGWEGTLPHAEFDLLVEAIGRVIGRGPKVAADSGPTPGAPIEALVSGSRAADAPPPLVASRAAVTPPVTLQRDAARLGRSAGRGLRRLAQGVSAALRSGSPAERAARWRAALTAAAGAGGAAIVYGGIWGAWRGQWGWVALPAILAGLLTYVWVHAAQHHPPRAVRNGVIAGLVAAPILTAVMAAILNPTVQMARWVTVESLAWGVYGLSGAVVIERGRRLRVGPPILAGLAAATVAVLILIAVIYREFSGFRLMTGAGWIIAMAIAPLPQAQPNAGAHATDEMTADKASPS